MFNFNFFHISFWGAVTEEFADLIKVNSMQQVWIQQRNEDNLRAKRF